MVQRVCLKKQICLNSISEHVVAKVRERIILEVKTQRKVNGMGFSVLGVLSGGVFGQLLYVESNCKFLDMPVKSLQS